MTLPIGVDFCLVKYVDNNDTVASGFKRFHQNKAIVRKVKLSCVNMHYFTLPLHLGHPALLRHLLYT